MHHLSSIKFGLSLITSTFGMIAIGAVSQAAELPLAPEWLKLSTSEGLTTTSTERTTAGTAPQLAPLPSFSKLATIFKLTQLSHPLPNRLKLLKFQSRRSESKRRVREMSRRFCLPHLCEILPRPRLQRTDQVRPLSVR